MLDEGETDEADSDAAVSRHAGVNTESCVGNLFPARAKHY